MYELRTTTDGQYFYDNSCGKRLELFDVLILLNVLDDVHHILCEVPSSTIVYPKIQEIQDLTKCVQLLCEQNNEAQKFVFQYRKFVEEDFPDWRKRLNIAVGADPNDSIEDLQKTIHEFEIKIGKLIDERDELYKERIVNKDLYETLHKTLRNLLDECRKKCDQLEIERDMARNSLEQSRIDLANLKESDLIKQNLVKQRDDACKKLDDYLSGAGAIDHEMRRDLLEEHCKKLEKELDEYNKESKNFVTERVDFYNSINLLKKLIKQRDEIISNLKVELEQRNKNIDEFEIKLNKYQETPMSQICKDDLEKSELSRIKALCIMCGAADNETVDQFIERVVAINKRYQAELTSLQVENRHKLERQKADDTNK